MNTVLLLSGTGWKGALSPELVKSRVPIARDDDDLDGRDRRGRARCRISAMSLVVLKHLCFFGLGYLRSVGGVEGSADLGMSAPNARVSPAFRASLVQAG